MISLARSGIAGSYLGVRQQARLELRVDVGDPNSLDILSGDLFFETNTGITGKMVLPLLENEIAKTPL